MKIAIGIILLVVVAGVAAAAWLRIRAGRDTSATVPCTAKVPGKVAISPMSTSE